MVSTPTVFSGGHNGLLFLEATPLKARFFFKAHIPFAFISFNEFS